jgi:hypothetical protein
MINFNGMAALETPEFRRQRLGQLGGPAPSRPNSSVPAIRDGEPSAVPSRILAGGAHPQVPQGWGEPAVLSTCRMS